jgi:hypothetical protein
MTGNLLARSIFAGVLNLAVRTARLIGICVHHGLTQNLNLLIDRLARDKGRNFRRAMKVYLLIGMTGHCTRRKHAETTILKWRHIFDVMAHCVTKDYLSIYR